MAKMSNFKPTFANVEIFRASLNRKTFNGYNMQRRKNPGHKLAEAENMPETNIIESNKALNSNVQHKNMGNRKLSRSEKENYHEKEVTDCEIIELVTVEKSHDDVSSNKHHKKKRKHEVNNVEKVPDCELNQHKKKHKPMLLGGLENVCNYKIKNSNVAKSSRILDELYKQKIYEQTQVDKSECLSTDISELELCQNNLNSKIVSSVPKQERHELATAKNSQKTSSVEPNHVSNNAVYRESVKEGILKNSDSQSISKVSRKNDRYSKTKAKNYQKKKCKSINNANVIKSNSPASDVICPSHKHAEQEREKSIVQNSVADIHHRRNGKNKELVESRIEIPLDNIQDKIKNVSCKESEKNSQEIEDAYTSFDPFINDLVEMPVTFLVPLLHEGATVASITPERRAYLEENGVTIHTGKWTKAEDDVLTKNFQQFGLEFGINNPYQLLGINQNQKDNNMDKYKKAKHFLVRLGKDLNNRSLRSIYMRARKLFTPFKNKEKLSAEETSDLKYAYEQVGNKWTRISEMLSRSDDSCHSAFRWHKDDINKGKWTPEEESNLIKAIKVVTGAEDISAHNLENISWKAVAKYVPTRNEFQCRKQWAEHLAWDTSVSEKKRWKKYHYGKLIYLLKKKYSFNSEYEIDWKELYKHFIDVAPSYIFLHKKWHYLKGRLHKELNLTFSKCLDALQNMYKKEYQIFADENL